MERNALMHDPRIELIENFDKYRIGTEDTFAFKCRSCGKCCKNRDDILLTPRDVYNLATALCLTPVQVIEECCEVYIGETSRMPVVKLKPQGRNRTCPLLVGNRCSVHRLKPSVCALFPLGRVVAFEDAPPDMGLGNPREIQYIFTNATCGSQKKKQTVRAWLEGFNIPLEDSFFIRWNETISKLTAITRQFENTAIITENSMKMVWGAIYSALYLDYDTGNDFIPQFEANTANLLNTLAMLEEATRKETK
jgi:Fe-S-cluster containining protein